jgi:hypothetical protein
VSFVTLRTGIREAARHKRLAGVLWLVNLLLAVAAVIPAFVVLGDALRHSPEGDRLLEGFSFGLTLELFRDDARFRVLPSFAAVAGLLAVLANAFVSGGVLDVLTTDDRRTFLHRFGRGAGHFAGRFLRMGIAAGVVLLVTGGLVMAGTKALSKSLEDAAWPPTDVAIVLVRMVLLLGVAGVALVALDLARIRVVREDSRRAIRLYWSSLRTVFRHPLATLGLWAANNVLVLLVAAAYLTLRNLVPASTWAGILLMFVAQQAVMLARAGLRIALFAGEMALVDRLLPAARSLDPAAPPAPAPERTILDEAHGVRSTSAGTSNRTSSR